MAGALHSLSGDDARGLVLGGSVQRLAALPGLFPRKKVRVLAGAAATTFFDLTETFSGWSPAQTRSLPFRKHPVQNPPWETAWKRRSGRGGNPVGAIWVRLPGPDALKAGWSHAASFSGMTNSHKR